MPRGIPGSGPYSKINADGSPKVKGEVQNDLAVKLKDEPATEKASASRTRKPRATKAPARKPRKAPARTTAASASNGTANGNGHVQTINHITIDAKGQIQFVGDDGKVQKLQLADPTYLLKLEGRVKEATDQYIRDLAASRS